MKSDRSCWVGFAAGLGLGLGVGCWVGFASGVGLGLGLGMGCWVGFAAGVGLGLGVGCWVGFRRGWIVPERMGTDSTGGDGYG